MKVKVKPFALITNKKPEKSAEFQVFVSKLKEEVKALKDKYDKEDKHYQSLTSLGRANAYNDVLLIIERLYKL